MAELTAVQRALLDSIAGPESAGRYNVIYGGSHFDDYSDHPRQAVTISSGPNKGLTSSAAGKYQFLKGTWDEQAKELGLTDFSPASQDQAAWHLAKTEYQRDTGRDLEADLSAGDLSRVPGSLKNQWTSMPGGIEQGISGGAFERAFNTNLGRAPAAAPAQPGGGWLSSLMGGAKGGLNSAVAAIGNQTAPLMRSAQNIAPAAMAQALSTVAGRTALTRYLSNQNVAKAPVMVSGARPGGTQVMTTNGQPGTLMRAANGQVGGESSRAFDAQYHPGQNMDVYRANAAAAGGAGNLNQAGIKAALMRGATLVRENGGGGGYRSEDAASRVNGRG